MQNFYFKHWLSIILLVFIASLVIFSMLKLSSYIRGEANNSQETKIIK